MVGWLLRILLLFMLIRALMLLFGGLVRGLMNAARLPDEDGGSAPAAGKVARSNGTLVQDPVCGTYVLQDRALVVNTSGGPAFFCSERCRSAYDAQATRSR